MNVIRRISITSPSLMRPQETAQNPDDHDAIFSDEEFVRSLRKSMEKKRKNTVQKIRETISPEKNGGRPFVSGRETFQGNLEKKGYMFRKIRKRK